MYRGRFQQGDTIALSVLAVDANGSPGTPATSGRVLANCPVATVVDEDSQILVMKVPVCERYLQDGFFSHSLVLDGRFPAARYTVNYQWIINSVPYGAQDTFEVVAGGNADGPGISLYYFRQPPADFLLHQTDAGRVLRRRNPHL